MSWTDIGMRRTVIALVLLVVAALPADAGRRKKTPDLDVPYVPTRREAVDEMLKQAKVTQEDFVMDLGCGDGRIVITAAKTFKARGMGVDLDPKRVRESKRNATKAGVTDLVEFREGDVMKTDVRKASVVTLFLLEEINVRLRPKLFAELKPGVRVVSNSFTMRDWKPDREVRHPKAWSSVILYWMIPAPVGGTWSWQTKVNGKDVAGSTKLEQEFQAVRGTASLPGASAAPVTEGKLAGKDLRFTVAGEVGGEKVTVAFQGTAEGEEIRGTQKWSGGPCAGTQPWLAKRNAVDLTGRWQVRAASHADWNGTLSICREKDALKASYVRDEEPTKELPLGGFYAWGSSVRFETPTDGYPLAFRGTLGAEGGGGTVAHELSQEFSAWSAKRLASK